ncbi:hypothetical protein AAHA92_33343 [Salvia divinorum]|uniref:Pectinesterase inhibitor domain-containing protein n=1 Tax=Salvia divinorum TaxID=28513 RepID=A0ABD1FRX7_SALDI
MSPSIISFPTILLISSIILLSYPKHIAATPPLIQRACSNSSINIDTKLCLRILPFIPRISSAKDLLNLSIAIMESGVSYSTNTLAHVEHVLKRTRAKTGARADAFGQCKVAYGQVVERFTSALEEVRRREYVAPTYELLTASTDCIKNCGSALALAKVEDKIIWRSGKIMPIFGLSAFSVIDELDRSAATPPTSHLH